MSKFLAVIEAREDFYLGYPLFIDYLEVNFWSAPNLESLSCRKSTAAMQVSSSST